jgi:DNA polymerase-3 subunit gamma/tau
MTGDAQNAFLKILEDTPSHVYFILCTTDPQSLLPTIKGRCSQFQVQPLSDNEMTGLLLAITEKEADKIEDEIVQQIIQDSQGHPRNALQILQQVLVTPRKKRLAVAKQAAVEQSESIALCRALMQRKGWKTVSEILKGLKGQDPEGIRRVVLGYATSVLLNKDDAMAGAILECFEEPTYNIGFPGIVLASYRTINYE